MAVKRMCDMVLALFLGIVALPIMLIAALAIKLDSPGSIFFRQIRTGLGGQNFQVYKFRSMCQNAESNGVQWAKAHDPRVTRVGGFLRAARIDELPQLLNVLRGEMSLIGPRPERPEFDRELRQVIPYYDLRYSVKPGITGWAQVSYPYGASIKDARHKLSYDLFYIKNFSLWLDVVVLIKTVKVVLMGKGI